MCVSGVLLDGGCIFWAESNQPCYNMCAISVRFISFDDGSGLFEFLCELLPFYCSNIARDENHPKTYPPKPYRI